MPPFCRSRPVHRLLMLLLLGCIVLTGGGWMSSAAWAAPSDMSSQAPRANGAAEDGAATTAPNDDATDDATDDGTDGTPQQPSEGIETPVPLPTKNPFGESVGGAELDRSGMLVNPSDEAPGLPTLTAQSFLVADMDSGDILAAKDPHGKRAPARAMLPLTGLSLLPRLDPRAEYTVERADTTVEGNRVGLRAGEVYTIDQLFYPLFTRGSQDANSALVNAAGGSAATQDLMLEETRRLGAFDTTPNDPRALGTGPATSAYDLGLVSRALLESDQVRRYLGASDVSLSPSASRRSVDVNNADDLGPRLSRATGLNIDASGPSATLSMGMAEDNGRRLLVVVVGADAPAAESAASLLEWGFAAADQVESVGQLVTPDQVQRTEAARVAAETAQSGPSEQESPDLTPTATETADDPAGAAGRALLSGPLLPLWLWLVAAVFVVMATLRVRAVMRDRRDNGSPSSGTPPQSPPD